jgi:hypothetical protein
VRESNRNYCLVFLGLLETPEIFTRKMRSFGFSTSDIESIIASPPIPFRKGLTLREAREYADAVQSAGGRVNVREEEPETSQERAGKPLVIPPMESFTLCPQCGHKQVKAQTCVRCGFILESCRGTSVRP